MNEVARARSRRRAWMLVLAVALALAAGLVALVVLIDPVATGFRCSGHGGALDVRSIQLKPAPVGWRDAKVKGVSRSLSDGCTEGVLDRCPRISP